MTEVACWKWNAAVQDYCDSVDIGPELECDKGSFQVAKENYEEADGVYLYTLTDWVNGNGSAVDEFKSNQEGVF